MNERSVDSLLQLVGDKRRRQAIRVLSTHADGETTVDNLVEAVRDETGETGSGIDDRDQLAIQLYHVHLPKLADQGFVDFDPETGTVRYEPDEELETVVDSLPAEVPPTHP